MAVLTDVLNCVVGLVQALNPYAKVLIGPMPADNGIAMAVSTGGPIATELTKAMKYQLTLVLNGKHKDQQIVADTLNGIHEALTRRRAYPNTEAYQITNISTISAPSYIGREENDQWLYGSSLRVDFYYR